MKFFAALLFLALAAQVHALTEPELDSIGRRVWQNECAGSRDGLTSWNTGEDFGSFGIGHFIWYHRGADGPFEESFPALMKFFAANQRSVPEWMRGDCPWRSRAEFQADFRSARMNELRDLLAATIRLQSLFLVERMRAAQPKMLAAASGSERARVSEQFNRMLATSAGTFALIDYVNFKGEGTKSSERYKGEGWGLLQVLAGMSGTGNVREAPRQFGDSAARVLTRRVANSPPERKESRWLPGWKNRVRAYGE